MRIFFDEWMKWFEIRHLPSDEFRQMPSDETALMPIHHLPSDELDNDKITAFLSLGFTHHREILNKCKEFDERWYYILASSKGTLYRKNLKYL